MPQPSNPYQSPDEAAQPEPRWNTRVLIGNIILSIGALVFAYGALAFWLVQVLPPNGGPSGRLPSLYVLLAGMAMLFAGLVMRDLRTKKVRRESGG